MLSDAVDSFTYAFRPPLLVLYLAVLVGQFLRSVQLPIPIGRGVVQSVVHLPFRLGGLVLVLGGVVGVLHYVVSDVAGDTTGA
jgi:hypothetical protein